jgi:dihydroneopterin aldolase
VQEVSDAQQYALLEALATAVADELERRFGPERLRVRVRKPEVQPAGLEGTVSVTVTKP